MKVILDTNVIISAFAARGLCQSVFELCIDQYEIILSEDLIKEIRGNLLKKLRVPDQVTEEIISYLRTKAKIETAYDLEKNICRDPDDDKILGLAKNAKPDYIITGDNDLLVLEEFEITKIITPRKFWEIIRNK